MAKRKRLFPFWLMPGSWGLDGDTRELAEIDYYYTGLDHGIRRLGVLHKHNTNQYNYEVAKLKHSHELISDNELLRASIPVTEDETEKAIMLAKADLNDGEISQNEHDKRVATAKGESWVNILRIDTAKEKPSVGSVELDWNDYFVAELKEAGYEGLNDEAIVDQWLNELCRNIAVEAFSGTGDIDETLGNSEEELLADELKDGKRIYK